MSEPIRILVADDHPVVREGLAAILSTQVDFAVVGEAATGEETVRLARTLQPDVLLLDLEMPDLDGVAVLRQLREESTSPRALIFTAFDTDERILAALRAGARGYLLKGAPREQVFAAVRSVYAGSSLLQPLAASRLLRQDGTLTQDQPLLTTRERDVLRLLARGQQNKEIAAELVVTERTVKFHVSAILAKLGAGNRTEAVAIATKRGLVGQ